MLRHHPLLRTLGCRALRWRELVEPESQHLTEAQQVCTLRVRDMDPLPSLARPHERGVDQLQATPFIKEARDDL